MARRWKVLVPKIDLDDLLGPRQDLSKVPAVVGLGTPSSSPVTPGSTIVWAAGREGKGGRELDLLSFDRVIVAFSGGKDSTACVIALLERGVPREKIELWHHRIDPEGSPFMDWPCTGAYCEAFAKAFGLPLYFQWKEGGFERELFRKDASTAPTTFEVPGGGTITTGGSGPPGTRGRFPMPTSDLRIRWCSAYLKIDVARKVFTNDPRFQSGRFLMVTGERGSESPSRAKYAEAEEHSVTKTREVVQYRPVLRWSEEDVWDAMKRWRVNPHPAYRLGFGRVSCISCIFSDPDQWATLFAITPERVKRLAQIEIDSGSTIRPPSKHGVPLTVLEVAKAGTPYAAALANPALARAALQDRFDEPIFVADWKLPAGAFRRSGGPT